MTETDNNRNATQPAKRKFLEPGTVLAQRYRVLSVLGQGGMGVVYKVQHIHMERELALKTLASEMGPDSEPFRRFQREAKAIATLKHPNIVDIHDFAVNENQAYLVMDFLDGISIEDAIDQFGPMGLDHFVHIFSQACEALHHAHTKGIIHRDLKGGNMMIVTEDGRHDILKVVDFGVAKILTDDMEEDSNLTRVGGVVGSPLFMSPEQCLGMPYDHRIDIYSLGIVMYRCLTGELPIVGENALRTLHKQISEKPASFAEANPDVFVPESLESVIQKALAKKPEERQQTMLELLQELKSALSTPDLAGVSPDTQIDQEQVLEPAAQPLAQDSGQNGEPVDDEELWDYFPTETDLPVETSPTPVPMPMPVALASAPIPTPAPIPTLAPEILSELQELQARKLGLPPIPQPVVSTPPLDSQPPTSSSASAQPSASTPASSFAQRWRSGRSVPQSPANQGSAVGKSGQYPATPPQPKARNAQFNWGQFDRPSIPPAAPSLKTSASLPPIQRTSPPSQVKTTAPQQPIRQQSPQSPPPPATQAKEAIQQQTKKQLEELSKSWNPQQSTYTPKSQAGQQAGGAAPSGQQQAKATPPSPASASGGSSPQAQGPSGSQPSSQSKPSNSNTSSTAGNGGRKAPARIDASDYRPTKVIDDLVEKILTPIRKLFQPKSGDPYVQEVQAPEPPKVSRKLTSIVVCSIIAVAGFAYKFFPWATTSDQAFGRVSHRYKSADGQIQLRLIDTESCELQVQNNRIQAKYRFFLGDWRDALDLSFCNMFQKPYSIYETPDGIVDQRGNSLYAAYSPESKLFKTIDKISKYAANCYAKEKRYPDTATRLNSEGIEYENPFTKEQEAPSFQMLTIGSGKDKASDDKDREDFYSDLLSGGRWKGAPLAHPGMIRCCAVHFKNSGGDTQAFAVQAIGGDGKPVRGFRSDTGYFYALENGKAYKGSEDSEPEFPINGNAGIWYYMSKPDSILVFLIENGVAIVICLLLVAGLAIWSPRGLRFR